MNNLFIVNCSNTSYKFMHNSESRIIDLYDSNNKFYYIGKKTNV